MKVVLFFDQIQSGFGGKERPNVELGVEKGGIGSYMMFEKYLKEINATVIATTYCGDGYFENNEKLVLEKMEGLINKLNVDILLCGPCFNYYGYAKMSMILAEYINRTTKCRAIVMCSEENTDIIEKYKNELQIIKMPKKGGVGLNQSLQNMAKVIETVFSKKKALDFKEIEEYLY